MMSRFKVDVGGEVYPLGAAPPPSHMCGLLGSTKLLGVDIGKGMVLVIRKDPSSQKNNEIATALLRHGGWVAGMIWGPALVLPASDLVGSGIHIDSPATLI